MNIKTKFSKILPFLLHRRTQKNFFNNTVDYFEKQYGRIKYKLENLYETNLLLGQKHYNSGAIFDAKLRFWLIGLFKKNDQKAMENLALCLYRSNKMKKLHNLLSKINEFYPQNEISRFLQEKLESESASSKIENIPNEIYDIFSSYNYFLQEEITIEERKNYFLRSCLRKYFSPEDLIQHLDINCNLGENALTGKRFFRECNVQGLEISAIIQDICKKITLNNNVYNNIFIEKHDAFFKSYKDTKFELITINFLFDFHSDFETIIKKIKQKLLQKKGYIYLHINNTSEKEWIFDDNLDIFRYNHRFICDILNKNKFEILEVKHKYQEPSKRQKNDYQHIRELESSEFFVRAEN